MASTNANLDCLYDKYLIWPFLLAWKGFEIMYYDVTRPMTSQIHSYEIGKSILHKPMAIYGASHYTPSMGNL